MSEGSGSSRKYFKEALTQFSQDVASGGAIRHLTDIGYTARQITDALDFPTPFAVVQRVMWEHLTDSGVILLDEPGSKPHTGKGVFVKEYGQYGRVSFRRIPEPAGAAPEICWQEYRYQPFMGDMRSFLREKCEENGATGAYASLEPARCRAEQTELGADGAEYLDGLPGEAGLIYHRLDGRMQGILCELYGQGAYKGTLYFERLQEKVRVE